MAVRTPPIELRIVQVSPGYDVFSDEVKRDWHVQPAALVEDREVWSVDEYDSTQGFHDRAHLTSSHIPGTLKDVIDELVARVKDYRLHRPPAIPSSVAGLVRRLPTRARNRDGGRWAVRVAEVFLQHEKQPDKVIFHHLQRAGLVSYRTSFIDFRTIDTLRDRRNMG